MPMQSPGLSSRPDWEGSALKILLTRPREQSEALAATLAAEGWAPVIQPMMEFAPTGTAVDLGDAAALVFTSANGVRAAGLLGFDGPVYAVGAATAEAARAAGFAQVIAAEGDGADLARLMLSRGEAGPVLHLRGRHVAGEFRTILEESGIVLRESVVYEMRAAERLGDSAQAMIWRGEIDVAPFYSARTASIFAGLLDAEIRAGLIATVALAISHDVAKPLSNLGFARIVVADAPTGAAMLAALREIGP
jgi:uroporphyrinogen-III synthase